jgi:hypothetical protein
MNPGKKSRRPEGGGAIGCGCGFILGAAVGLLVLLRFDALGVWLSLGIGVLSGILGWKLGDAYFERVLRGDPEGKPIRYWWFP